ncbi:TPA: P22 phage major capsid protein family protein [Escherichia coli]
MPNNLDSNVSQIVLKKFLPGFMSDLVLAKTVDRQLLAGEINSSTGDSVSFKRPHQFSSLRTPTGDISGKNKNNLISGKATGRVGNYITVAVEYQQLEEAIKLNQLEEILAPVRQRIVTDLETELAHFMMNNGALSLGSPNTPITKWSDVAQTASFLKDLGVNEGENYAVMDPWSAQRLADAQTGLHASDQLVRTAWEDAQIPTNFGGIRALMSNGLASRTQGAFGGTLTVKTQPTVTYNAVKDSYQFTPLAEQYVNQLQNLSSLEGQGQALNQYYNSQQYKDLAGQARYQSLAAAEATGGLGSTATSNQLATIAPTLGQSWLSNQMSNYNNLANVGLGALQGQANAGQTYANNMSSIAQQSAALAAANANKPSSLQTAISGGTSGAIAGAGLASLLGTSTPWGAGIGAGIGLLGSLF